MACLSPEALVQLWNECLDYARKNRLGVYGVELSPLLREKIDHEYDELFGEKRVPSHGDKTGP